MSQIKDIISSLDFDEDNQSVVLPKLEEKLYNKVSDVLKRLGINWNKSKKIHTFDFNPISLVADYLKSGNLPLLNPNAFFPTSTSLTNFMLKVVGFDCLGDYKYSNMRVLEPSGGQGGIADAIVESAPGMPLDVVEIFDTNQEILKSKGHNPICMDFMDYNKNGDIQYDWIFMNPPFSVESDKKAYISHVEHAYNMLERNGVLVAIVPNGFLKNKSKKEKNFLELVSMSNEIHRNPKGSFSYCGTDVETCTIVLYKSSERKVEKHTNFVNHYTWYCRLRLLNNTSYMDKFNKLFLGKEYKNRKLYSELILECIRDLRINEDTLIPLTFMDDYIDIFIVEAGYEREYMNEIESYENITIDNEFDVVESVECNYQLGYSAEVLETFSSGFLF